MKELRAKYGYGYGLSECMDCGTTDLDCRMFNVYGPKMDLVFCPKCWEEFKRGALRRGFVVREPNLPGERKCTIIQS